VPMMRSSWAERSERQTEMVLLWLLRLGAWKMRRSVLAISVTIAATVGLSTYTSAECTPDQRLAFLKYYSVSQVGQLCGDSAAAPSRPTENIQPQTMFATVCATANGGCPMAQQILPGNACTCFFSWGPAFGVSR
jgi:hypothetical protein